jgi:putative FmdB family regulatory protein
LPTYEYACTACGHRLDAVQKFSDDALTVCPECGGTLRKVYGAVGIVLKGSGFYKTDSRVSNGKAGSGDPKSSESTSSGDTKSADSVSTPDTSKKGDSGTSSSGDQAPKGSKETKPAASTAG